MRKPLFFFVFLLFLAGGIYVLANGAVLKQEDFATEEWLLLPRVEVGIKKYHDAEGQDDTLLYMLARVYIHSGKFKEAETLLPQIHFLANRRFMRELYAGLMLEYFSRGENGKAFAILEDIPAVVSKVNDTGNTALQGQVKKHRQSRNMVEVEVRREFCQLAGKLLAAQKKDEVLQELLDSWVCVAERAHLVKYGMARYMMAGDIEKAFALFQQYRPAGDAEFKDSYLWQQLNRCLSCPPPEKEIQTDTAWVRDTKNRLIAGGDDAAREIFAEILLTGQAPVIAQEVAESVEDESRRTALLAKVSTAYLKQGQAEAVKKIYDSLGSFQKPPIEYGGSMESPIIWTYGITPSFKEDAGPQQWYDKILPEVGALHVQNAAVFDVVMGFENNRTRFTALESFYGSGLEDILLDTEGCKGQVAVCVLREMEKIADTETDKIVRDYMYYKAIEYALKSKLLEQAKTMAGKVEKTDRVFCRNHVCFFSMINIINGLTGAAQEGCERDIAESSDGLLQVIGQMDVEPKKYWTEEEAGEAYVSGSHHNPQTGKFEQYYVRKEDYVAAEKRRVAGLTAVRCHIVTRKYREYFAQPDILGVQRDSYFSSLGQGLRNFYSGYDGKILTEERLALSKDRLRALSLISDEKLRRQKTLGAIADLNRWGSYFYRAENEQVLLEAMDGYDSFRKDIVLWEAVLNGGTDKQPQQKLETAQRILKPRPWLAEMLLENRSYHGDMCQYMVPLLKTPDKLEKPEKEQRDKVFHACVLNLVKTGAYDTALRMAQGMAGGGEYFLQTQLEILLHKLNKDNLAFRLSELDKKYHENELIGDGGFLYAESATWYGFDRPWRGCPFFGLGLF